MKEQKKAGTGHNHLSKSALETDLPLSPPTKRRKAEWAASRRNDSHGKLILRKGTESTGSILKLCQAERAQSCYDTRALAGERTTSHRTLAVEHHSRLRKFSVWLLGLPFYTR